MKPCSLFCLLTLLLAAPVGADPPRPSLVLQVGHSREIVRLAYSPDGKTLATGGGNGEVRLWDVASGQVKATLQGHTDDVWSLVFSPDGKTLATWGKVRDRYLDLVPGPVDLWDVASGQLKATLDGAWTEFAFSPDGKTLATWSADLTARLWDVATGQLQATLRPKPKGYVNTLAFAPDGKTLAAGGGSAWLWDVATGQLKATLQGHTSFISALAFSPDGKTLATGSYDKTARLWDVATGQLQAILVGANTPLAFSPDGKRLATGDITKRPGDPQQPGSVGLWDVATGQPTAILRGHADDTAQAFALSPDGKTLATGHADGTARLWDVATGQLKAILQGHTDRVYRLAFTPDGKTLATGSEDKTSRLWDVATGQPTAILRGHVDDTVQAFALSPDGKTLATWSFVHRNETEELFYTVWLWDVASGRLAAVLETSFRLESLAFSSDGRTVAIGGARFRKYTGAYEPGAVDLWDLASGQMATLDGAWKAFAFTPDGKTLATGSDDGTVGLWDVATGQLKATLDDAYPPLAFSPDGKTLATASYDSAAQLWTAGLWEVASGHLQAILRGHTGYISVLAFAPDGKTLATRDDSGKLRLWDVGSGMPIPITAQTPLAQFPPEIAHPVSWVGPALSLLDPFDEHVLATLQPLPDAPPYAAAPLPGTPYVLSETGGEWIALTPEGYFEGSANLAPLIRWNLDGVLYPAATYWDTYYRPDLVRQALSGSHSSPP